MARPRFAARFFVSALGVVTEREENRVHAYGPKWTAIFKRDCGLCGYCGRRVEKSDRAGAIRATVDHRFPLCRGGTNDPANLLLACWDCNQAKMHHDEDTFRREKLGAPCGCGSRLYPHWCSGFGLRRKAA